MRTNYSRPFDKLRVGRQRGPRMPLGTWVALAALALAIAAAALWRGPLGSLLWRAWSPVVAARDALWAGQVDVLRAELASTTAALADRNLLYRENLDLKARLGRDAASHRVLAAVLQAPPAAAYDTFIIDAGRNAGLAAGQRVFAAGSVAVGTVVEVYATTARVSLYSSPGATYAASIVGATGSAVPVSVVGQGGGSFTAQVPAGTDVSVGDPVVFAGVADTLTSVVSAVDQKPGSSFADLYMHLPVNLFALRWVEVEI